MSDAEAWGSTPHIPVLYHEIIHAIQPLSPGLYVDCTVGAGGHAWGILQSSAPDGRLLGLDLDPQALALSSQRLALFGERVFLVQASYGTLAEQVNRLGWTQVEGIVMDLGFSSMQINNPDRGFSFLADGPLDMRFSPTNPVDAAWLVNHLPEDELADIFWRYGEENHSHQIARAILRARPITTTRQLAEVIARSTSRRPGRIHPATRSFQALRIAVNQELNTLEETLPQAFRVLAPGGRLAVITFHSLEDRIVKHTFQRESQDCLCPPEQPVCTCGHRASIKIITRHPIEPSVEEVTSNSRARSARLRVIEKF
jgi:16S rRNA (cytosine1402-N4)-methyltransferase